MFYSAWSYRNFILSSIITEFRARILRSRLGVLWMVLTPLAQVAIYALVLSHLMASRIPGISNKYSYIVYLMSGTLSWSLFSDIVTRCLNVFIDNSNLLKKIVFPKICLPLIVIGSALINNFLLFVAIFIVFFALGFWPSWVIIVLPFLVILNAMLAISFGLILGNLNVFIRDIGQIVPILLQFGFWLTPIVYMPKIIPASFRYWFRFNPMYSVVNSYHDVLVYKRIPHPLDLLLVGVLAAILIGVALFLFRKTSVEMVDVL